MKNTHVFSSDQKLEAYGYGEWVEEPDLVEFTHKGIDCIVSRIGRTPVDEIKEELIEAGAICLFQGNLCGYIKIPEGHPFTKLDNFLDISIDCHHGLTFGKQEDDGFWIGFDCGHMNDFIPGLEMTLKRLRESVPNYPSIVNDDFFKQWKEKDEFRHLFTKTYRNIAYCINECKSMADQLLALEVK